MSLVGSIQAGTVTDRGGGAPVICLGQQPCGFFPRRFLVAKLRTARRLREEIGGEIVFFVHDSDHDPRETQTTLRHRRTGEPQTFNFTFANKLQRKYTPLAHKRVDEAWVANTARQLPAFVEPGAVEAFKATRARTVADFCLEVYGRLGLLDGVRVVRSADPDFRRAACVIDDFYVDVRHEGEVVRARRGVDGRLCLHAGGDAFVPLPETEVEPWDRAAISPTRDTRLRWMQSVVRCTHYVCGAGEQAYLRREDAPEIVFVNRDPIERADEAYAEPIL